MYQGACSRSPWPSVDALDVALVAPDHVELVDLDGSSRFSNHAVRCRDS